MLEKITLVLLLLTTVGCGSNVSPPSSGDMLQQNSSARQLYQPLLDAETPEPCETNCQWPLQGSEWRLIRYVNSSDQDIPVTGETLYTLLFSELDERIAGIFGCNTLAASYAIQQPSENTYGERAEVSNVVVGRQNCLPDGLAAEEYRFVSEFLTAGAVTARTGGSLLYLENALGQQLTYRARLDALDGEYRTFRTVMSGDYLPFSLNAEANSIVDVNDQSTDILIYESLNDFENTSPELISTLENIQTPVEFDTETLVGLFLGKLNYLGPDIVIDHVIERDTEIEVQTHSGLFWCDDGIGQPRGENAPFRLSALLVIAKPVNIKSFASLGCP